jgi:AraC-like DNA-binding protein
MQFMAKYFKIRFKEMFTIDKIITLFYFELSKSYLNSGEAHDFWEMVYVDKGEIAIMADSMEYTIKAGEIVFHKPNEFHLVRANGFVAPNITVVTFECNSPQMLFFENKIAFLNDREKQCLADLLHEGKLAFEKVEVNKGKVGLKRKHNAFPGSEQMTKIHLEILLISLYRRREAIHKGERLTAPTNIINYDEDITYRIKNYLYENLYKSITLDDVSKHIGLSCTKIKRTFKAKTGSSIMTFFTNLKITEAKLLIREKSLNFTEISNMLCYSSIHYFSSVFKSTTGMTPTEYSLSIKP